MAIKKKNAVGRVLQYSDLEKGPYFFGAMKIRNSPSFARNNVIIVHGMCVIFHPR